MSIIWSGKSLRVSLFIIGAIFITVLFPFELVIAPERRMEFVDNDRKPISEALIDQTWYQYALGERGNIKLKTNTEGLVILPKRTVRTSIISLLWGGLNEFMSLGIHASYSSSEIITVFIDNQPVKWFYDGEGLESGDVVIDLSATPNSNEINQ